MAHGAAYVFNTRFLFKELTMYPFRFFKFATALVLALLAGCEASSDNGGQGVGRKMPTKAQYTGGHFSSPAERACYEKFIRIVHGESESRITGLVIEGHRRFICDDAETVKYFDTLVRNSKDQKYPVDRRISYIAHIEIDEHCTIATSMQFNLTKSYLQLAVLESFGTWDEPTFYRIKIQNPPKGFRILRDWALALDSPQRDVRLSQELPSKE